MAHIKIDSPHPTALGAVARLRVDETDLSNEVFIEGLELVPVGTDPAWSQIGLRVTIAVGQLDLNGDEDILAEHDLSAVAQRIADLISAAKADA